MKRKSPYPVHPGVAMVQQRIATLEEKAALRPAYDALLAACLAAGSEIRV